MFFAATPTIPRSSVGVGYRVAGEDLLRESDVPCAVGSDACILAYKDWIQKVDYTLGYDPTTDGWAAKYPRSDILAMVSSLVSPTLLM